jgi:hypothetical protein
VHYEEEEVSEKNENLVINNLRPDLKDKLIIASNFNLLKKVPFLFYNFS